MALGDCVVQGRVALAVSRAQRAAILKQQADHGRGADGCGAVNGILATVVADPGRGGGIGVEEEASHVQVLL